MAKFEIKMPKLGESITEGTIISWSIKVGDTINEDDILFEVNTAKVSAEIPSPVSGKILEILFKEGDTVSVGTVVAIVELEGEEGEEEVSTEAAKQEEPTPASAPAPAKAEEKATPAAPAKVSEEKVSKGTADRWYSPVVLQKAKDAGISQSELDSVPGTGYEGRLSKRDIELYIDNKKKGVSTTPAPAAKASTPAAPAPSQESAPKAAPVQVTEGDQVIPMDAIRRIIADRMVASKKISPHVTNVIEVDVTKLVNWREQNKDTFKKREGVSLTYMSPIVEATAKALKDFPRINSSVDGYNIIEKKRINIGVAVSLNDGNLIVPVIKDADKLSLSGLALSVNNMANKARANKLSPDEIQGGTFTITNFGSFKSLFGTPIINQPEVAILGVGIIEKKPVVVETPEGDVIAIRHKMYLSLSYDHRVVDGMLGGNFLYRIAEYLENWNA
ncbi:Lipoamide acyltransferase component of branched-chain alpha-keto acid dehydrogenase complex [uncultured Dysgonomonas sp.]|uniref:Dihydrolipoamide acetyltransferase component of pyruvate dehydrogenase complex n=1 Tax=uncultured Dysgonomonas sp. TaxID=206096 RepID=A0A212JIG7_9BACT|nr:dihydrolipoamide acetyltransferase family protein [uncultured Dysgonomonas sp.]SBV99065.1 Lipoamide acyltransferase component of branched-chain alpha-keto acid dehydrogenase complex [uncultured Dysgonomonas sp.]